MNEFVSNGSSGVGNINFASGSCAGGVRSVREACSWRDCMFSASKASQANGCSGLLKFSSRIPARENMELVLSLVWFSGICFLGCWGSWC